MARSDHREVDGEDEHRGSDRAGAGDQVGDEVEVLADGGVRTGLDVVKMVALGARAVLVGRAWAWAVAARGEAGVQHMLEVLKADIDTALGLTGQTSIAEVDRSALHDGGALVGES